MQSTLNLLKHLYNHLPPLYPEKRRAALAQVITSFEDANPPLEQIEETLILFGYEVWPWRKAYEEFYAATLNHLGEQFFLPKLSEESSKQYRRFKHFGGSLRDVFEGHALQFFPSSHRAGVLAATMDTHGEVHRYAQNRVMAADNARYLARVAEFTALGEHIRQTVEYLESLADAEQDHPNLAGEIRARARAFEYGICGLAPEPTVHEVSAAPEYFAGRRHELNRLKGIHVPLEIDWWGAEAVQNS